MFSFFRGFKGVNVGQRVKKLTNLIFESEEYDAKVEFYPTIYKIGKISRKPNWWDFSNFLKGLESPLVIYRDEDTQEYGWGYLESMKELQRAVKSHITAIGGLTLRKDCFRMPVSGNKWWKGAEALTLLFGIYEGKKNLQHLKELSLPAWSGYIIIEPLSDKEFEKLLKKIEKNVEVVSRLAKEHYRHQSEIGIDTLKQVEKVRVSAENKHLIYASLYHAMKNSGKGFRVYLFGDFSNVQGLIKTNKPEPSYLDPTTLAYLTHPPEWVDNLPNPTFKIPSGIEKGDIHFGYIWQKGHVYKDRPVYFSIKHLSRHFGIFGKTGSGKTNALEYFVYQMQKMGDYHIVIFDKEGQYCGWKDKNGVIGDFEVIDAYYDNHYQINLFDVFFDISKEEIAYMDKLKQTAVGKNLAIPDPIDIPMETFISIYKTLSVVTGDEFGSTQVGILRRLYKAWIEDLYNSNKDAFGDTPEVLAKRELLKTHGLKSFINFIENIGDITQILGPKVGFNTIDAYTKVKNKLDELQAKAPFLCSDVTMIDIEKLMKTNFILNLFNLYNKTNSLFAMGMVAYAYMALIWNYHRQHPPETGTKPTILIIDEVQNYAPSSKDIGMTKVGIKKLLLTTIMEEGRKWGVWAVCAGPTLVGLDDSIRRQPGSYLFFQFTEADEKEAVYSLIGDKKLKEEFDVGELGVGQCIARILITDDNKVTNTSSPFGLYVPYAEPLIERRPYPYDERELKKIVPTTFLKDEFKADFERSLEEAIKATASDEYRVKYPPKIDLTTKTFYNEYGELVENAIWIDAPHPIIKINDDTFVVAITHTANLKALQLFMNSEKFIKKYRKPKEVIVCISKELVPLKENIRKELSQLPIKDIKKADIIGYYEPPEEIKRDWLSSKDKKESESLSEEDIAPILSYALKKKTISQSPIDIENLKLEDILNIAPNDDNENVGDVEESNESMNEADYNKNEDNKKSEEKIEKKKDTKDERKEKEGIKDENKEKKTDDDKKDKGEDLSSVFLNTTSLFGLDD